MFLIQNNQMIHRMGAACKIGSLADCDIQVPFIHHQGVFARIFARDGVYMMENTGLTTVLFNNVPAEPNTSRPISNESVIQINGVTIQCFPNRTGEENIVSQAIDNKILKIQIDIHTHILDVLKRRNDMIGSEENALRRILVDEIDLKLSSLILEQELMAPLLKKATKKLLLKRVEDPVEKREKKLPFFSSQAFYPFDDYRLEAYIGRLENILQLDKARGSREKFDRINTLLSWGTRLIKGSHAEIDKLLVDEYFKQELLDIILGLGPIQELMESDEINDIMVLPSGHIFVDKGGQIEDSEKKMLTSEVSLRIVEKIISEVDRRIDQTNPMVDARISDGSRLNAIISPIAVGGPALTIRKFADSSISLDQMVKGVRGKPPSLTLNAAKFLELCVLAKKNIIVSGGTGSGKTTLLNALSSLIPADERIVVIEDTTEIKLDHRHIVQLQSRPANMEGENAITIRQLVKNSLRMRPNRIIIGECRSGETLDMLQAMNTGHEGSLTTIHANTPSDALRRIEVMSMEAEGINLPSRSIRAQIASAIDLVIQINRFPNGRKITSISEIVEYDDETSEIIIEDIFKLRDIKRNENLVLPLKELTFTGYIPVFTPELLSQKKYSIEEIV